MGDEGLLTSADVAKRLGVTPQTVARWVRQERLTPAYVTPGNQYRFRWQDVRKQLVTTRGVRAGGPVTARTTGSTRPSKRCRAQRAGQSHDGTCDTRWMSVGVSAIGHVSVSCRPSHPSTPPTPLLVDAGPGDQDRWHLTSADANLILLIIPHKLPLSGTGSGKDLTRLRRDGPQDDPRVPGPACPAARWHRTRHQSASAGSTGRWDRTRLDDLDGARIWTGHGALAHNLVKIAALAA